MDDLEMHTPEQQKLLRGIKDELLQLGYESSEHTAQLRSIESTLLHIEETLKESAAFYRFISKIMVIACALILGWLWKH